MIKKSPNIPGGRRMVSIRLEPLVWAAAQDHAQKVGITATAVVEAAIIAHLKLGPRPC